MNDLQFTTFFKFLQAPSSKLSSKFYMIHKCIYLVYVYKTTSFISFLTAIISHVSIWKETCLRESLFCVNLKKFSQHTNFFICENIYEVLTCCYATIFGCSAAIPLVKNTIETKESWFFSQSATSSDCRRAENMTRPSKLRETQVSQIQHDV